MENINLELLHYQIKLLNTMVASTDNFNSHFFSFVIDHNITETQTKSIMQGLVLLKDRMRYGKISDEYKTLYSDSEVLKMLDKNMPLSFSEFQQLVHTVVGEDISAEYLLKSLIMQGINIDICKALLDSKDK